MPAQHGLGRRYAEDARDEAYPMRLRLDPLREQFFPRGIPEGVRHYRPSSVLDQGRTGTCVGHAWASRLRGAPIMQGHPGPFTLYRQFILVDEWAQNDREALLPDEQLQFGTSVRAGAKVCQSLGYVSNYLWAESTEDVRAWHLANFGSVVLGVNWTSDMMRTDASGFIHYTGRVEGGHAVVTTGWNDRLRYNGRIVQAVRCQNSWGTGWGQQGRFWLLRDDLERLIADRGEACAPTEVRVT
jgi:hypothetical protein